jgi:hypothetical protein
MASVLLVFSLVALVLIVVTAFLLWWLRRISTGAPVRPWWLALLATFSFFLFLLVERPEWVVLGGGGTILDLSLLMIAGLLAGRYVTRRATLWKDVRGRWVCRVGFTLPILWILLFVLRLVIEGLALPHISFLGSVTIPRRGIDAATVFALLFVGGLLAIGTGIILGEYAAIYFRYRQTRRQPVVPPGAVGPLSTL